MGIYLPDMPQMWAGTEKVELVANKYRQVRLQRRNMEKVCWIAKDLAVVGKKLESYIGTPSGIWEVVEVFAIANPELTVHELCNSVPAPKFHLQKEHK